MLITLTASTYELQFYLAALYLCRAVSLKDTEVCPFAEAFGYGLCEVNATTGSLTCLVGKWGVLTHHDYINIGTVAMQEYITHISANDIALQAETVGFFAYKVKNGEVYFGVTS